MELEFDQFRNIYEDDDNPWWTKPLTFNDFVKSQEHMNHPGLTEAQLKPFTDLVGKTPDSVFAKDRTKYMAVIKWGKGSGKDLCSSLFQNWVFYLTLCMKSPTQYFGMPAEEENIDIVNVAQNQDQAIKVYFNRFTKRLKKWPWLLKHFRVYDKGKLLNPEITSPRHDVNILSKSVTCSNSVSFHSLHSASQGYEGFNILMFTIDEGSAFPTVSVPDLEGNMTETSTADQILDVLKTSAESRNWKWLGIMISYPRAKNCFISRKFDEAKNDDTMVCSKAAPWEVLPESKFSGEWVIWNGFRIPKEKLSMFEKDPDGSSLKFLCETKEKTSMFFREQSIKSMFKDDLFPLISLEEDTRVLKTGLTVKYLSIDSYRQVDKSIEYFLAGDFSKIGDRTILGLAHGEEVQTESETFNKRLILDQLIIWQPDKINKIYVSHESIHEIVNDIIYNIPILAASFDQLESQLMIEKLSAIGIKTDKHNVNDNDYLFLRTLMDLGLVWSYPFPLLEEEAKTVRYFQTRRRVDHTNTTSKDVLDVVCALARLLYKSQITQGVNMEVVKQREEEKNLVLFDWSYLIPNNF